MKSWLLAASVAAPLTLWLQPGFAADQDHMLDVCRSYAAKHLHVSPGVVNVKYEGKRTDGTHAVNGDTESNPPFTFQCSFNSKGTKVVRWYHDSPAGCPSDVSEADRYKYPDCD